MLVERIIDRMGKTEALDPTAARIDAALRPALTPAPVRSALSGAWLGHRLHPTLTDAAISLLASAAVLDLIGGRESERGADRLLAGGLLASVPTAITGLSDWIHTSGAPRRIGMVHAMANTVALAAYGASLAARRRGKRATGIALSAFGATALTIASYLGGHLSYAMGVGVNTTAFRHGPADWTDALPAGRLAQGTLRRTEVAGLDVLLVRRGEEISALDNRCAHAGCALDRGLLRDGAISCSCHGSTYRLRDGAVVTGPAASAQRTFDTRVVDGIVQIRAR